MFTLLIFAIFFLISELVGIPLAQAVVLAVLGLGGSLIIQLIKRLAGTSDLKAYALSVGVSILLSILAVWLAGAWLSTNFTVTLLAVLATSNFTYQVIIKNLGFTVSVPTTTDNQ